MPRTSPHRVARYAAIVTFLVFFLPWHNYRTAGISYNLWTSSTDPWNLNWGRADHSDRVLLWERSEFGPVFNYLVIDRGVGHPAWYARLDLRVLILDLIAASFLSVVIFIIALKIASRRLR
ncbi:MAG TPA: hypothetical protein VNB29_06830 [Chthoniobacterales bacterium]|nr:hypothetical protein [Chthoniobacterales bacterium]